MKNTSNELQQLLEDATQEEMLQCIELLALNIAQQRTKSGAVAVLKSMEQLRARTDGAEHNGFFVQGKEVLEEALEAVRVQAAANEVAVSSPTPDAPWVEKRQQFRINITAPVKLLWPQASTPVDATLQDISWGGAAIHVAESTAEPGDSVRILLPGLHGESLQIDAQVLRTWLLPNGQAHCIATRFSSLRTSDEAELEALLERLAQSADHAGQRNNARLAQRLDIEFNDMEELGATLDDISVGGMGITVPEPLQIGQSLQAVVSTLDGKCSLKLRARVVRQDAIQIRNMEFYHVGLKFEHPTEELHASVSELIHKIAGARPKW